MPNSVNNIETIKEIENEMDRNNDNDDDNDNGSLAINTSTISLSKHVQIQVANTPPNKTIHPLPRPRRSSLLDILKHQSLSNKTVKKSINQSSTKVINFQNRIIAFWGDIIKTSPLTSSLIQTVSEWSEYINKLVIIGEIDESVLESMKGICESIMIYSEDEFISFFSLFYFIYSFLFFFNFYFFYNSLVSDFLYSIDVFIVLDTKSNEKVLFIIYK